MRSVMFICTAKAHSHAQDHTESTAALEEAILAFPSIVPVLADKADISLPASARGHSAFRVYPDAR